jgi:hypothetical protein
VIRPFTLITMLLAALSGAYLFAVKHQSQVLDDQIAALSQSSRLDAMRIRVLQGQWSLETDPTRLQQLAAQFTSLQPMRPAQLVTLAALVADLPAAGSAAPASNPGRAAIGTGVDRANFCSGRRAAFAAAARTGSAGNDGEPRAYAGCA